VRRKVAASHSSNNADAAFEEASFVSAQRVVLLTAMGIAAIVGREH
tara:strand:- start:379 stop:516 length:138 start_codon:yes stop_codon:yes gene_type:complete